MEQVKLILLGILVGFFIIGTVDPSFLGRGNNGEYFSGDNLDNSQPVEEKLGGGVKSYRDPGDIIIDPWDEGPGGN